MMSRVDFAFGAPNRLRMACEVVHKHFLAGRRLVVYTQDAQRLAHFDRLLWSFEPAAFIPHVMADDPLAPATPVILTASPPQAVPADNADAAKGSNADTAAAPWLLNLDLACPPGADAFERILEIVSDHEEDKAAARTRWREYQAAGHTVHAHDVSGRQQSR
jgi:DNA polymerase-3 subunit chi